MIYPSFLSTGIFSTIQPSVRFNLLAKNKTRNCSETLDLFFLKAVIWRKIWYQHPIVSSLSPITVGPNKIHLKNPYQKLQFTLGVHERFPVKLVSLVSFIPLSTGIVMTMFATVKRKLVHRTFWTINHHRISSWFLCSSDLLTPSLLISEEVLPQKSPQLLLENQLPANHITAPLVPRSFSICYAQGSPSNKGNTMLFFGFPN